MSALSTHFDRYHSKDDKLPVCTIGAAKKQINSPKAYALGELLVRVTGVEPARRAAPDPKSGASANSAIPAYQPFVGGGESYCTCTETLCQSHIFLVFIDRFPYNKNK